MRRILLLILFVGCLRVAAQSAPARIAVPKQGAGSEDPLAMGKNAMQHGSFEQARSFFADFVKDNPESTEAWVLLGRCEIELKDFDAAIADLQRVVVAVPSQWAAHNYLALAYAKKNDWADFDKERALIKDARDKNLAGVDKDHGDVVDLLTVKGEEYEVRYFYKLFGSHNVRYVFLHFGKDGKVDHWIEIESLDVDQAMFAENHPKEAAAGKRVYSMDSMTMTPSGFPNQALFKFYEGDPTYETLRADAIKALGGEAKVSAAMTPGAKK